ncbi:ABC transporter G family member 6 [Camellia lanceoleosa]|uniref:ABC transporter G family member 6 n=1 Tax=Camellia lanceoleosa TaxID=1840588 RepID=A0ACC0H178_9ERIC|nr:ABC transporter G family member 6 [Camellia lanceoleosa]
MDLPSFFSDFGHSMPENENKTEFALDFIRELEGSSSETKSLVEFNKTWQSTKQTRNLETPTKNLSLKESITASVSCGKLVSGATNNDASSPSMLPNFANPFPFEITVLSKRSMTNFS